MYTEDVYIEQPMYTSEVVVVDGPVYEQEVIVEQPFYN